MYYFIGSVVTVNQSLLISSCGKFNPEDSDFSKLCSMKDCVRWGKIATMSALL